MLKEINKKTLVASVLSLILGMQLFFAVSPTQSILAQDKQSVCDGVEIFGPGCGSGDGAENTINTVFRNFLELFSAIVGVVAVAFILYGGFKYVTSGGDSGKIASAQTTIIYGLVGVVVAALAQVLVRFVLAQVPNAGGG